VSAAKSGRPTAHPRGQRPPYDPFFTDSRHRKPRPKRIRRRLIIGTFVCLLAQESDDPLLLLLQLFPTDRHAPGHHHRCSTIIFNGVVGPDINPRPGEEGGREWRSKDQWTAHQRCTGRQPEKMEAATLWMPRKGGCGEGYYDARWRDKGRKSTTTQGSGARRQEATTSCGMRRKKPQVSVALTSCPL
jgi:hypothetical protein